MNNLSAEETIIILKKVFISATHVKEEALKFFMESSEQIDSEIIYQLLLNIQDKVEKEQILRILKWLPEKHRNYLEAILPLGALLNSEKEKLYEIFTAIEQNKQRRGSMR